MKANEFLKENYSLTNGGEDYICNHSGQLVGVDDISNAFAAHIIEEVREKAKERSGKDGIHTPVLNNIFDETLNDLK